MKQKKAKDIGGYKLWYSGSECKRNEVGIMVSERHQSSVVDVKRFGDRIIMITLVVGLELVNVICGYAVHVGLEDMVKKNSRMS